jgi:hypothetical protein
MSLEICTHCVANSGFPHYSQALRVQLASILRWPPAACGPVTVRVILDPLDKITMAVVDEFSAKETTQFRIVAMRLQPVLLWCRSPGRDLACQFTKSDIWWACDSDYIFGYGCLDAVYTQWQAIRQGTIWPAMFYPDTVDISRDHRTGDLQLRCGLDSLADGDFVPHPMNRAIGGLFIVDGDFARAHGYLRGTKWCEPRPGLRPFAETADDVAYRRYVGEQAHITAVPQLPGLRRIRHSVCGYAPTFRGPESIAPAGVPRCA